MGSAFSIFISNCLYGSLPKGHITAFATHSTGIKKKVRNPLTASLASPIYIVLGLDIVLFGTPNVVIGRQGRYELRLCFRPHPHLSTLLGTLTSA